MYSYSYLMFWNTDLEKKYFLLWFITYVLYIIYVSFDYYYYLDLPYYFFLS